MSQPAGAVIADRRGQPTDRLPPDGMYDRVISEVERPLLSLALGATRGNQLRAARLLGLNRNTLRKKIKDLDVPVVRTPQVRRGG